MKPSIKGQRLWNARPLVRRIDNDTVQHSTEFHVGWVHYLDAANDWQEINCCIRDDLTVVDAPFKFEAPKLANGPCWFEVDNRFDVSNKSIITARPLGTEITALQAKPVPGEIFDINGDGYRDAVIYRGAFPQWDADLIYYVHFGKAPRLKKLVRFNSPIKGDISIDFRYVHSDRIEITPTIIKGDRHKQHWNRKSRLQQNGGFYIRALDAAQKRGMGIKKLTIWDSNPDMDFRKTSQIKAEFRMRGGDLIQTKYVPAAFFDNAVFPVYTDATLTAYPDPDAETTTMDAIIAQNYGLGSGVSWTSLVNAAGNFNQGASINPQNVFRHIHDNVGNQYRYCGRSIFGYDTSSIGDTDNIDSGTKSLYGQAKQNDSGNAIAVNIYSASPASNTAIADGDYDSIGTTEFSTEIAYASLSTTAYNDYTLNASGLAAIDKTGVTNFGAAESNYDIPDVAPTWSSVDVDRFTAYFAEETGTTKDPKLVVNYTAETIITPSPLTNTVNVADPLIPVLPDPVTASVTVEDPILAAVIAASPLTMTVTLESPAVNQVLVTPSAFALSTTLPTVVVALPLVAFPNPATLSIAIPDPDVLGKLVLIAVHNYPSSTANSLVNYKIVDGDNQTVIQDWTDVEVVEHVRDDGKSSYYAKTALIAQDTQAIVHWRYSADNGVTWHKHVSEAWNIYDSYAINIRSKANIIPTIDDNVDALPTLAQIFAKLIDGFSFEQAMKIIFADAAGGATDDEPNKKNTLYAPTTDGSKTNVRFTSETSADGKERTVKITPDA